MSEYVIMPKADYVAATDTIRAALGKTDPIKSGELAGEIKTITDKIDNAQELTVDLDFSQGDMVIDPSEDILYDKVSIAKPSNLASENIAEGVEIAGVVGNLVSGGGLNISGDLLKYVIYQLDMENKEIVIYSILWSQLYADTGSYNLNIPGKLGEFQVVLVSEGVS